VYLIDFLKKNFSKDHTINIIDIGCGSGRYYEYISNLGSQLNYIGLDIAKNTSWKNSTENKKFYEVELGENNTESIKKIASNLESANLVFSHSALEHIKNDISAIQEINEFCPNALHLHLVPAPSMFLGEILHGWRRYTQNNYKKFNLAFQNKNRKITFDPVGNQRTRKSFFPHYYKFNQKKMAHDFFNYYQQKYDPLDDLRAISLSKNNERPVFYAMVIKHC
jgi:SAM-dependent methyltransferase